MACNMYIGIYTATCMPIFLARYGLPHLFAVKADEMDGTDGIILVRLLWLQNTCSAKSRTLGKTYPDRTWRTQTWPRTRTWRTHKLIHAHIAYVKVAHETIISLLASVFHLRQDLILHWYWTKVSYLILSIIEWRHKDDDHEDDDNRFQVWLILFQNYKKWT